MMWTQAASPGGLDILTHCQSVMEPVTTPSSALGLFEHLMNAFSYLFQTQTSAHLNTVGTWLVRLVLVAVQAAPIMAWFIVLARGLGPGLAPSLSTPGLVSSGR